MQRPPTKKEVFCTIRELDLPPESTKAVRLVDEYLSRVNSTDVDVLLLKGNILEMKCEFDAAIEVYQKILQVDRGNPSALINLGDCYSSHAKQQYQKALRYYNHSLRVLESGRLSSDKEDEFIEAYKGKANALLEAERPMDALKCIVRGLDKYPADIVLGAVLQKAQEQYATLHEKKLTKLKRKDIRTLRAVK